MKQTFIFLFVLLCVPSAFAAPASEAQSKAEQIARGRYLTILGACNDCHTPNFPESGGRVPEKDWLTGVPIGWHGPWGTTYAMNLRLLVSKISSDEWVKMVRTFPARPPMPAYIFQTMTEEDIRAMYAFIHSLGAAGTDVPEGLPPGVKPKTPYFNFVPVVPDTAPSDAATSAPMAK